MSHNQDEKDAKRRDTVLRRMLATPKVSKDQGSAGKQKKPAAAIKEKKPCQPKSI